MADYYLNSDASGVEDSRNSSFCSASDASYLVLSQKVKSLIYRSRIPETLLRPTHEAGLVQADSVPENQLKPQSSIVCLDKRVNAKSQVTEESRNLYLESFGLDR